jgi:hypothetical protein
VLIKNKTVANDFKFDAEETFALSAKLDICSHGFLKDIIYRGRSPPTKVRLYLSKYLSLGKMINTEYGTSYKNSRRKCSVLYGVGKNIFLASRACTL